MCVESTGVLMGASVRRTLPVAFLRTLTCKALLIDYEGPRSLASGFKGFMNAMLNSKFSRIPGFISTVRRVVDSRREHGGLSYRTIDCVHRMRSIRGFRHSVERLVGSSMAGGWLKKSTPLFLCVVPICGPRGRVLGC